MQNQTIRTICFECHSRCGVFLETENGKISAIRGDKDHPHSHGYICPKARAVKEMIYHPQRIMTPLVRTGDKKSGTFRKASWDDALSIIAEHLLGAKTDFGAESIVFGSGTTRGTAPYIGKFLSLLGSPNFMAPSNYSGGPIAMGALLVSGFGMVDPDYINAKHILLWAHNPEASWAGLYMHDINRALKNGARLTVIDPRGTRLAQKADHWLRIRPGSDTALALGFLNVIIENELYDKAFVKKWTTGFDDLKSHVAPYTPEACEKITWIPAGKIKAAAMGFARTGPGAIGLGMGGCSQANDAFDLVRAITMISAITGNMDIPGGNLNCSPPTRGRSCYGKEYNPYLTISREQAAKKLGIDRFPLLGFIPIPSPVETVWPAILEEKPYPVKAMGLWANNAVCAFANSPHVKKALSALDFLFCVDYYHTPTTALADVILPAAHWSERDDVEDLLMKNCVICQNKAVEPQGLCLDEKQILIDLAKKMGLEGYWGSIREMLDHRLKYVNMSFEEFKKAHMVQHPFSYRKYETKGGFRTGTGKVELCTSGMESFGIKPMPGFIEPAEGPVTRPDLMKKYPFILTTGGRNLVYYHSSHRNIPSLRKKAPDPELQIHPDAAAGLSLEDGQWVYIITPRGSVEAKARYFEHIDPRVVQVPHGFWYGDKDGWERFNINMITDNEPLCPVSAGTSIKALLCRIEKKETRH